MKSILITGANSGFGYLSTLKFAQNGYKVYATTRDISKKEVQQINEIAKNESLEIEWLVLDVTNEVQIQNEIQKIESLDILVNNAGFGMVGFAESFTALDLQKQFDTNLFGVHRMIKATLPLLKKSNGRIINVSSLGGKMTYPRYAIYSGSKYALEGYSEALRMEMNMVGVQVALVEPGTFSTGFSFRIEKGKEMSKEFENKDPNKEMPKTLQSFLDIFRKSANPQKVADAIFNLSLKRRMPLHNYVGSDAKLLVFLRKILPERFWDYIVISMFK